MSVCSKCGNVLPEEAKFCPVCGAPVEAAPAAEPEIVEAEVVSEETVETESSASGWYQSAESQQQTPPPVTPVSVPTKPSIGRIFDFYRKAFAVLAQKPIKLWGLSLLYLLIASLISSLGSLVPIITIPIVLVLSLGFTGVLLKGYHGEDVNTKQLFQAFKKEEIVRNGAGMCWMELWTLIWGFVPVMNVIKYYSYSFTPYILLTDKTISATESLKKSMRMTDGYKGKLFGADILIIVCYIVAAIVLVLLGQIPYIGWIFMVAFFLVNVAVFLFLPIFMGLVHTAFFEEIRKVHEE
ncbi:MAG: zinc-ribbon domain-containing protein [Oscillospiraceae bacterium]|nr:zinc-ribbon domain-containing protein [Oscillospiraceae bacterium]